jgi:predicted  nucleic acid-binding Zn ribbon protein
LTIESPLRCGNCFGIVPLYKIPKTYDDDEYYDIKCWEINYRARDSLQMNCRVGERFGMRQLSEYSSKLNKYGMDICKKIKKLTGKDVYYYLYNRAIQKPQFLNSFGNSFNIKTAESAAILRQIRQTCERTERLSNKSNYKYSPARSKELNRKCPSCGGEWILENRLFNRFNFKCDKCLLVSNISASLL